jgi:sugar/nucleoside kinase (ribokinase family)
MTRLKPYDLICIGNYTKDTILSPAGTMHVDGGAVNYAAHAAHQLGVKVAVVTRLAEEDRRVIEKFTELGIDTFPTYSPQSTTMRLEYPTDNPDQRLLSVASNAGSITSADVKDLPTRAAVIGTSFRGEVGLDVIRALKQQEIFLGADAQGFARVLRGQQLYFEPWDEMYLALPYLDVLKSDSVEAQCLTGNADIYRSAKTFSELGAKEIIITHKDGVLVYSNDEYHLVEFHASTLSGRSGRGDTCLGAYMAMRLSHNPASAIVWAAAVTSMKMEKLGPFDSSLEEVVDYITEKYPAALPA